MPTVVRLLKTLKLLDMEHGTTEAFAALAVAEAVRDLIVEVEAQTVILQAIADSQGP